MTQMIFPREKYVKFRMKFTFCQLHHEYQSFCWNRLNNYYAEKEICSFCLLNYVLTLPTQRLSMSKHHSQFRPVMPNLVWRVYIPVIRRTAFVLFQNKVLFFTPNMATPCQKNIWCI